MNKIAKAVWAFLLLLLGVFALLVIVVSGVPYWRAQRAIAQRKTELAAAKPLKVNPGSLVGTWYGKGGPNRELVLTLTITSDARMAPALNPGDPGEEVERQMLSPYSMVATLGIDGLASNGCSYESLSLNGNASGNTVQLTGYKGSVGDTPNPRLDGSLWQDTDGFQFSARLSDTGMSGLLSTASNKPGCRPMIIPFDLSLVEVPAGQPAYVAPPAVPAPETNKRNGPSVPEQPTSSTAQPSQRSDAQIETDAVHALDSLKALKNDLITVTTIQNEVTLSGTVSNDASSELAEWTVSHVPGVTTVHNDLQLSQVDRNSPRPLAQLQKLMPEPAQSNTGVLHYHGPPVPTGGKVVFDLPNVALEHLRLAYDRSKWERVMMRNRDDTGWVVVLTSDQLGYQTRCDLTWEIVE